MSQTSDLRDQVASLQRQVDAAAVTNSELTDQLADMNRVQGQALVMITRTGPFFRELTELPGVEAIPGTIMGDLTTDHQGIKIDFVTVSVVLDPWNQTVTVNDIANDVKVKSLTVPCTNGDISEADKTLLLGHVQRILRAASGTDPVASSSLLQEAASTQG